ncbi:MAG TPA: hypothetical protein VFQ45_01515 [Longimicrobium sp.]|nr:hypothetical protein [Longimicrobium sp.]
MASILTPLILGIGGWYLNQSQQELSRNISHLQTTVATVEAMPPYFDMLVKPETAQAKMAAYALYMLKRDDPQMVVSLILASNREELKEVLIDLGSRDTLVYRHIASRIISREGANESSDTFKIRTETAAQEILAEIPTTNSGWVYFGTFSRGRWGHGPTVSIGSVLPEPGKLYRTNRPLNIREALPSSDYQMANAIGVVRRGEVMKVHEVHPRIVGNHVWAKVTIEH